MACMLGQLTRVRRESEKEAALSMGLKVGDPVENLTATIATATAMVTETLIAPLWRQGFSLLLNCGRD